jgi:hypothetical protein
MDSMMQSLPFFLSFRVFFQAAATINLRLAQAVEQTARPIAAKPIPPLSGITKKQTTLSGRAHKLKSHLFVSFIN